MKKLATVFVLAAMLFMGSQAMAQSTRGALFLGGSFPIGDYGKFNENFSNFALTSTEASDDLAGAGIGFNVGMKWCFNVGLEGLGVMLSADGIYNGPNPDLKTAYRDLENSYNGLISDGSLTLNDTPKYIHVPVMAGLNYICHFNPNFGVYVEAGAGCNMRILTKKESVSTASLLGGIQEQITSTQSYDMGFSFAYQVGTGIEVAKNLVIGCSFYDLGKAQVKGEEVVVTKTTIGESTTTNTDKDYHSFGTMHPYIIMARIGFSF